MFNRDIKIATVAQKFVEAPYSLGDQSKGWDCLTIIKEFYGALGFDLPTTYRDFTFDNYSEKWKSGEGREEFLEYLSGIGEEVGLNFIIAGDLLIFDHEGQPWPGIYLGNEHVLFAFEKGCYTVPLKFFKKFLLEARRCLL